ncbi:MAG: aminoacyl-tRNA hydrolase [Clostridiales bacterium]|jgi:PTH1 family peptidyl-tRNA hydrolase|nr:aminoacyl-tRNA hydrolase [Clostridiales bacterium]
MYIIAGLGNPGNEYKWTRHNVGFEVISKLAFDYNIDMGKSKYKAIIGDGRINGKKVLLVKPLTYMNLSGESISQIMSFYKEETQNLIVVCDDINLPVGNIRIRKKGSDGGQKGLRSIIEALSSEDFPRVRVGVGSKPEGWDLKNFVLSRFTEEENDGIIKGITDAGASVVSIVEGKTLDAMNMYNKKNRPV